MKILPLRRYQLILFQVPIENHRMTSHDASQLKITAVHEACEGGRQTPKGLIMLNIVASICVNGKLPYKKDMTSDMMTDDTINTVKLVHLH